MGARVVASQLVPLALLRDEPARRGFITALRARATLYTHEALRVRVRSLTDDELTSMMPQWRVPYIAARRSQLVVEVVTR